jgi:hypothetical protein
MSRALLVLAIVAAIAAAAASASARVGFYGCRAETAAHPRAAVEPRSLILACADGNAYLTAIRWSAWGASSATGIGVLHRNDCTPYCAAGHFHTSRATVTLSKPESCKGKLVFDRVTWQVGRKVQLLDYGC